VKAVFVDVACVFLVLSIVFGILAYTTSTAANSPAPRKSIARTASIEYGLPYASGRASGERATVVLTITGPETIVPYDFVRVNVTMKIPFFLLTQWIVSGGGPTFRLDNAQENLTILRNGEVWFADVRPSEIFLSPVNTTEVYPNLRNESLPLCFPTCDFVGHDIVQFTSEGAIGGWVDLAWLPRLPYWQIADFNDTDIQFHVATPVSVQPSSTLELQKQATFFGLAPLAQTYLFISVTLLIAAAAVILDSYRHEKKGDSGKEEETKAEIEHREPDYIG
jgi:hypothetical protein